ncbi:aminoglycoside phosphotransferase family protein [Methylophaga sp. OBS4]|uniref:aminoglycoside phosphotransferase family protein n=1 Tax=Methylophaga sp. OBS4 TaxID=2991935 RepID=UPI00224CA4EC|nr:phosphotransferase [Methylophaga sp. OBS4]MCX4188267.1 phosphotransferase [Methylophaga sp. OBS4]
MNISTDNRLSQIKSWLDTVLPDKHFSLTVASSDASFRRYFRVHQAQQSWIVMDAPPAQEDIGPFITIAEFLKRCDINVPEIFARNSDAGFLLLTDLGDASYLSVLDEISADSLYQSAIDEIVRMQLGSLKEISLPLYDESLLQREMDLFPEWFLSRHLSLTAPSCLDEVYALLIDNAHSQPQCFVHRDFHSRNLMHQPDKPAGVIDFQDAVIGPVTYDLVSLLRDCYIEWPQQKLEQWLDYYLNQARNKGLLSNIEREQFQRWFDLMGLQRHLKVLGIFCRLNYRDGKEAYMDDLALTLHYVLQVTAQYEELAELHQFLTQTPEIMAIK